MEAKKRTARKSLRGCMRCSTWVLTAGPCALIMTPATKQPSSMLTCSPSVTYTQHTQSANTIDQCSKKG